MSCLRKLSKVLSPQLSAAAVRGNPEAGGLLAESAMLVRMRAGSPVGSLSCLRSEMAPSSPRFGTSSVGSSNEARKDQRTYTRALSFSF